MSLLKNLIDTSRSYQSPVCVEPLETRQLLSALPLTWTPLGEPGVGGRVDSIAVSPHSSDRVLIGGDMLGVGVSNNRGDTWQQTSGFQSWEISDFTYHPTNNNEVWAGTLGGPYRSTDGGVTWQSRRSGMPGTQWAKFTAPVETILYDMGDGQLDRLLAFTGDHRSFSGNAINYGQVYLSENNGQTWSLTSTIVSGGNIIDAEYAGGNNHEYLWAAVESSGVYLSNNDGEAGTWGQKNNGLPTLGNGVFLSGLVADPTDMDTAFVSVRVSQGNESVRTDPVRSTAGGIYRTTNRGASWQKIDNNVPSGYWPSSFRHLDISSDGNTLYAVNDSYSGSKGVYKSMNGGTTWDHVLSNSNFGSKMSEAVPFGANDTLDLWWVEVDPNSSNRVYAGGSQSVIRSTDGGATWSDIGSEPSGSQFRGTGYTGWVASNVEWNPYNSNTVVAQAWDAGQAMISDNNGSSWSIRQSGVPGFGGGQDVAFSGDGNTLFAGLGQAGSASTQLIRSSNGGASWSAIAGPSSVSGKMVQSIHVNPANSQQAWVVIDGRLFRSTNALNANPANVTWTELNAFGGEYVRDIEAAPSQGDDFYVATNSGIYKTNNGTSFTALGGPDGGERTALAVDPSDPDVVYATIQSSYWGDYGVWRLDTGSGGSWQRFFTADRNAAAWIGDLAVDPTDPDRIALITNQNPFQGVSSATGVWISEDGGSSWSNQNDGLRMLRGNSINFKQDGSRLAVGLNGGGFFVSDLPVAAQTLTQDFAGLNDFGYSVNLAQAKSGALAFDDGSRFRISNTSAGNEGYSTYAEVNFDAINITGKTASVSFDMSLSGDLEESGTWSDFADAYYRIDGGSWVLFGQQDGDAGGTNFSFDVAGLTGSTLELRIRAKTTSTAESYFIDQTLVTLT